MRNDHDLARASALVQHAREPFNPFTARPCPKTDKQFAGRGHDITTLQKDIFGYLDVLPGLDIF